jgi:hypothetical protein
MEKNKKIIIVEACAIFLFLFFIGSGIVINPFFGDVNVIDEGQFGAWLTHMLHGKHLYKDTYAAYGPFYIYPLYFLGKIFSPSVFLIRIVYIVLNTFLATIIVKFVLNKIGVSHVLQIFSILLLLIIPGFGMRQGIGFLAILLSMYAIEKNNYFWSIASGITLASSFLVSSEIGIFSTIICGFYFMYQLITTKKLSQTIIKIFFISISVFFLFLLFFFWANSEEWFSSYIHTILDDLSTYSGIDLPNGKSFPNALLLIPQTFSLIKWMKYIVSKELLLYWLFFFYVCTFCFFFIRIIFKKMKKRDTLVFLISCYGFFLSMILIGRYGHFAFTLSPMFILFAYYIDLLLKVIKTPKNIFEKSLSIFLICIICLFSLRIILIYRPQFPRFFEITNAFFQAKYSPRYVGFVSLSNSQKKSILTIQNFIEKNTSPGDTVFFFNNEPIMYMLVNRENPNRFDLPEVAITKDKRLEILNSLIKEKPKYIIDDTQAWSVDGVSNRQRLPEVIQFIERYYQKKKLDNFIIYTKIYF